MDATCSPYADAAGLVRRVADGARLLAMQGAVRTGNRRRWRSPAATMSPMFLLGTIGSWLNSRIAGAIVLLSVLAGRWLRGAIGKTVDEGYIR